MRNLAPRVLLFLALTVFVNAQAVKDCSQCSNAEWGSQWNPPTGQCASNPIMGCGQGCNCWLGFYGGYGLTAKPDFFGGAFTEDGGFRVDRVGPLAAVRIKAGDVIYRLNNRKPSRRQFATAKRPARHARATFDDQGRLYLWLR